MVGYRVLIFKSLRTLHQLCILCTCLAGDRFSGFSFNNLFTQLEHMIDFDLILETDKILLRPLIFSDFISFEKMTSDQSMWTYFAQDLSVRSELHEWVERAVNDIKNKTRLALTIIDKSSGRPIGSTSFGSISLRDKRIEIGWTWLSKESQGKGINSQVKLLMIRYLFEVSDCERVEFKTDILNIPARKALLRIGAKEEGVLRSHTLMTHGRRRDTIYYSILKSEWEKGGIGDRGI